jgi:hypothetical protein
VNDISSNADVSPGAAAGRAGPHITIFPFTNSNCISLITLGSSDFSVGDLVEYNDSKRTGAVQDTELNRYLLGIEPTWTVERVKLDLVNQEVDVWANHEEGLRWPWEKPIGVWLAYWFYECMGCEKGAFLFIRLRRRPRPLAVDESKGWAFLIDPLVDILQRLRLDDYFHCLLEPLRENLQCLFKLFERKDMGDHRLDLDRAIGYQRNNLFAGIRVRTDPQ